MDATGTDPAPQPSLLQKATAAAYTSLDEDFSKLKGMLIQIAQILKTTFENIVLQKYKAYLKAIGQNGPIDQYHNTIYSIFYLYIHHIISKLNGIIKIINAGKGFFDGYQIYDPFDTDFFNEQKQDIDEYLKLTGQPLDTKTYFENGPFNELSEFNIFKILKQPASDT
jgi:hypothetical protein